VTSTVTFADTDRGSLPGGDRERIASGGPVAGGGNGNGGGSTGTGGSAGGTAPTGASGGGGPEDRTRVARREPLGTTIRSLPLGESGSGFGRTPSVGPRFWTGRSPCQRRQRSGRPGRLERTERPATARVVDRRRDRRRDRRLRICAGEPDRATPTYENAPIRATAEDVPGFGPLQSLAALAVTLLVAIRTRRTR